MKKPLRLASIFIFVSMFFSIGCMGTGSTGASAGQISKDQYFTLNDLDGAPISLENLLQSKKAVLLNFWATWCPPCREEIPDLIQLQKDRAGEGYFTVLGIDVGESQKHVSSFVEKNGINYPVLLDSDQMVSEKFKIVGIPTSLLIDSKGNIIGTYHAVTPKMLSDVEEVLK